MKPTRHDGIYMLAVNKFRIRLRVVDPRTGQMKEVDRVRECTLKEALALQSRWREEVDLDAGRDRMKVKTYAESWLRTRLPVLKLSTAAKYANVLHHQILPDLGEYFYDALNPLDVKAWVERLTQRYAGWTVVNALRVLRTMTKDAKVDLRLEYDPCERVKSPRTRVFTDDDHNSLDATELGRLLAAIREHEPYWYALTMTLAFTGSRWCEATALRWTDLDQDKGLIHIRRRNWRGLVDTTKTGKTRSVAFPAELAQALEQHRVWLAAMKTARLQYQGFLDGWVFPSRGGGLHKGTNLVPVIRRCLGPAEIDRDLTAHGLRRTFNNLLRQVTTGEVVRSITGHCTAAMTEHYSHVDATEKQAATAKVLRLVRESGGSSGGSKNRPEAAEPDSSVILGGAGRS